MQLPKDQDFFTLAKIHTSRVLKKSTIESDMKDDNCLKTDVWIKQWNVSTYPGYWILVLMSRQTNQLTMVVRRGSVMATILILTLVTSPAVGMIPSNLSVMRLKRQITDEASGLRITDLWLKLLFDWFPNFFPGQLMTTPVLFMPQVRCFFSNPYYLHIINLFLYFDLRNVFWSTTYLMFLPNLLSVGIFPKPFGITSSFW